MMIKIESKEFDFLQEWESQSKNKNVHQKKEFLLQLAWLKKSALSHISNQKIPNKPEGQIRLEYDRLIRTACDNHLDSLIYEYVRIAVQKSQILPVNLLVSLIEVAHKNHDIASFVLESFSESGFYVIRLKKEWNYLDYLSPRSIPFPSVKENFFYFSELLRHDKESAIQFLLKNIESLSEKNLSGMLDLITISRLEFTSSEINTLANALGRKLRYKIIALQLNLNILDEQESFKLNLAQYLNTKKIDLQSKLHQLPGFEKQSFIKCLEFIPPAFYSDLPGYRNLVSELMKHNVLDALIQSIYRFRDNQSAIQLFRYLIDESSLTEDINTSLLTKCLDHKSFNEIAIYFCRKMKDQIDLEAFLHLINYSRHFWSDDLLIEVLNFHKHRSLTKKYDLDVFYQFIPYRINPNSKLENEIPLAIKDNINFPLKYSTILQFRKLLRK